jgi:hypothetical protein
MKRLFIFVPIALLTCLSANAQGNKTYVSYRGADTNACSRVLPCKTVNHALTVTASGGTVDIIDSGDYDAFVVNQDVTVAADPGVLATISCNNCVPIVVNGGTNVVLKNLHLNGINQSFDGIFINSNGTVSLLDLHIERFQNGISFQSGTLNVSDTTVENNFNGINTNNNGGFLHGSFAASRFVNNWQAGALLIRGGPYIFDNCTFNGINNSVGIETQFTTAFLSNSTITQNQTGVEVIGGSIFTFGNNKIAANSFADVDTQAGGQFTLISTK